MGVIVPFPMNHTHIRSEELGLLNKLTSDVQCMWRGGWAERGEPDGIVLLRNQQVIGVWFYQSSRYCYVHIAHGVITHRAIELADAFRLTLELLGPLRE